MVAVCCCAATHYCEEEDMWLDRIPASVAFCDVETTGLGKDDRIVSFGGIGMISDEFAQGRLRLALPGL